jgi:hypothetical protein
MNPLPLFPYYLKLPILIPF